MKQNATYLCIKPVRLCTRLIGAAAILLASCVTVPPSPSTATPEQSVFSPTEIARLREIAASKGWVFQGDVRTSNQRALYFVKPNSLTRIGNYARFTQLSIQETPVKIDNGWISSGIQVMQFDCASRTSQTLSFEAYSDRDTSKRIGFTSTPTAVSKVNLGSYFDVLIQRACSNSFGNGQGGANTSAATDSTGSGFIFAAQTVVTNQHVVAKCARVNVLFNGQSFAATVRKRDVKNDLALLDVPNLRLTLYPVLRNRANSGEGVMVAGFPLSGILSSDLIVTDGIVNALSGIANDPSQIQISAPVQPGNSGGPVIDKSGALIGVVVSKLNALRAASFTGDIAQNVNFAIKPEVLRLFVEAEGIPFTSTDAKARLETDVLAQKARTFTTKIECKNTSAPAV